MVVAAALLEGLLKSNDPGDQRPSGVSADDLRRALGGATLRITDSTDGVPVKAGLGFEGESCAKRGERLRHPVREVIREPGCDGEQLSELRVVEVNAYLAISIDHDERHLNIHLDSSISGRPESVLTITVEVGRRGGSDSGPRVCPVCGDPA